jgi:5-bromo-4-chloroindolyl phosphate hydrolysis protein
MLSMLFVEWAEYWCALGLCAGEIIDGYYEGVLSTWRKYFDTQIHALTDEEWETIKTMLKDGKSRLDIVKKITAQRKQNALKATEQTAILKTPEDNFDCGP